MIPLREQTTEERISQIAQGFGQGIQNFQQQRDRMMAQQLQEEAIKRQRALQEMNVEASISEATGRNAIGTGLGSKILRGESYDPSIIQGLQLTRKAEREQAAMERERKQIAAQEEKDAYEATQRKLPLEQRDDYRKAIGVARERANNAQNMYFARQEEDAKKKLSTASVSGFKIANPAIIPTNKDAEEVKSYSEAYKNFKDVGESLKMKISKMNTSDRTGLTNNWALIEQDLTNLALQAKDLSKLGVLNGPDLDLVNKDLGSISLRSLNTIGIKGAIQRLNATLERAKQRLVNKATSRGYLPEDNSLTSEMTLEQKKQRLLELRARKQQAGV